MNTFENLIFIPENTLIKNDQLVKGSREFLQKTAGQLTLISIAKDKQELFLPKIKKLGIANYFNNLFFIEDLTKDKPFLSLIKKLHLDPDDSLIIGADLNDEIKEAENEGLKSLWLAPRKVKVPISPHPTLKLSKLSDLEFYLNLEN